MNHLDDFVFGMVFFHGLSQNYRFNIGTNTSSYCWWFRNPAPVDMENLPLFTGLYVSQVVGLGISQPSTVRIGRCNSASVVCTTFFSYTSLKLTYAPLKIGRDPNRKGSYSNHPFLGAMLVSGRVFFEAFVYPRCFFKQKMYTYIWLKFYDASIHTYRIEIY